MMGQYWRLLTPMFLHGGFIHLGFNSYFLYLIGPQVEQAFGHWRFAAIYLLSGITGVIASFALSPANSIGASGALFGLIGTLVPYLYRNRTVIRDTRRKIGNILQIIGLNLFLGFVVPNIDYWAHMGGLLCGFVLGWLVTPRYIVTQSLPDLIHIKDESRPLLAWLSITMTVMLLGIIFFSLVGLKR